MTWHRIPWAPLLASALTFTACTSSSSGTTETPDASVSEPDASTSVEWDGGYVPLEEKGNTWPDAGPFAACSFTVNTGDPCPEDFNVFDLSACNRESLANANTDGLFMLTTRTNQSPPAFSSITLRLGSDGGTQYLNNNPITEQASDGNARLYGTRLLMPNGRVLRTMLATCEAPQAPEFTGCYAACNINGKVSTLRTFKSQRPTTWRAGEAEASGLGLVSERLVDIGLPVDIYVTKNHAYVVSITGTLIGKGAGGLTVFDVSDKSAPKKVKTIQLETDNYWNGVWAKGDALYVASADRGVLVFDITQPADPQLVRNLPGGNTDVHTVFVDGDRLYAAAINESVILFDITNPLHPLELNRYSPDGALPHDMFAIGDRLYVSAMLSGFIVADVRNPHDIRTLGQYTYAPPQYAHHNAVGTFGGRTIAFEGGEGPGEHLRVLDITDPAHIVKIGEFQLRPEISIHNMLLVGKKLYVAWYQEGVRVLDVSNPTKPTQVAHYNTYRETEADTGYHYVGAIGIRVPGDGFIYVVDTWRGLLILREQ
ncbi:LVIVD repeat-containing protein [Archangium violaceum]|uniref:LVIVD repeat-containing protein n=1 Tax=Archangium violaceum TaxID=83451 RepID=UPI0037C151A1